MYLIYQFQEWLKKHQRENVERIMSFDQPREVDEEREKRKQREAELEREWESRVQRIEQEFSIQRGDK
jgi:hypothetical protein